MSLMILGLSLSSASAILDAYVSLPTGLARVIRIARFQSIVLVVIGSLFYFSRFVRRTCLRNERFGYCSARRWPCWELFWSLARFDRSRRRRYLRWLPRSSVRQPLPAAPCCSLTRLRRWSDLMVERGIFGKRDSHLAVREFRDRLGLLDAKSAVMIAMRPWLRGAGHEVGGTFDSTCNAPSGREKGFVHSDFVSG